MYRNKHIYPMIRPAIRFVKFRILHVDDSPKNLAMGVAIGLFIAWTPTMGLQMLLALMLAIMLKANKFLAVTLVWISNVFTLVPIYLPSFIIGKKIVDLFNLDNVSSKEQAIELLKRLHSFHLFIDMWTLDFWRNVGKLMLDIGLPLWIGSLITATLISVASYIFTYKLIIWYRLKHPHKRFRKTTK